MDSYEQRMKAREERKERLAKAQDERRKADELKLDELEIEHGDENVCPVWTKKGLVVCRMPTKAECMRFQDAQLSKHTQKQRSALEQLGRVCVLHPDQGTFETWCEEVGGIPVEVGAAVAKFAELAKEKEEGK